LAAGAGAGAGTAVAAGAGTAVAAGAGASTVGAGAVSSAFLQPTTAMDKEATNSIATKIANIFFINREPPFKDLGTWFYFPSLCISEKLYVIEDFVKNQKYKNCNIEKIAKISSTKSVLDKQPLFVAE
jgi:hypothetical protein